MDHMQFKVGCAKNGGGNVKKGSKANRLTSGVMPHPLSAIDSSIWSAPDAANLISMSLLKLLRELPCHRVDDEMR